MWILIALALQGLDEKVSIDFRDVRLSDALEHLRDAAGVEWVVDPACRADERKVSITLRDVSARTALKLVLRGTGLGATVREGAIVILPESARRREYVTEIYDVRDLLPEIQDFPGPKIDLRWDPSREGWMG